MTSPGRELIIGDWSLPEFEYLQNCSWYFTEKIDGTNVRVMWNGQDVMFAGRTDRAQMLTKLLARLQERFRDKVLLGKVLAEGPVCLYGEGYGAGIQGVGGMYGAGQDFILFDVKYGDTWLRREDVEDIALKLGLKSVPIIGRGTLGNACSTVKYGLHSQVGISLAEGLVVRPAVELLTRRGARVIAKIKSRDFR
jgi:hypothetical protein